MSPAGWIPTTDTSVRPQMPSSCSKRAGWGCCPGSSDDCQRRSDSPSGLARYSCGMNEKLECGDGRMASRGAPAESRAASSHIARWRANAEEANSQMRQLDGQARRQIVDEAVMRTRKWMAMGLMDTATSRMGS